MLKNIIRALRLPFVSASILPFVFGSLFIRERFNYLGFLCGLSCVLFTHLSANLVNDYFDSRSGADWKDRKSYGFFGGSKLIQEGVFSEKIYLFFALFCALLAFLSVFILALNLNSPFVVIIYLLIITLSWQYTSRPLAFSYHYFGESIIFFLFGPALVMGGYFIQTSIFPDLRSLLISLPFGFLTASILLANEIPDYQDDRLSGKNNLVSIIKPRNGFLAYYLLVLLGLFSVLLSIYFGLLKNVCVLVLASAPFALKAGIIMKRSYSDKPKLIEASKLAINVQLLSNIILILGVII
jgi:1,4-dihydroxy-2-naphthoate octaprenyltransferase